MTEKQAIKILKEEKSWESDDRKIDAFIMGIEALEEIQQYRTIGTVEGFECAIESSIENYNLMKEYKAKVQEYEAIGTIEEFNQAMNFKKYFMELYGEGLEVANWHKNGDLEPLVNFIDEACN